MPGDRRLKPGRRRTFSQASTDPEIDYTLRLIEGREPAGSISITNTNALGVPMVITYEELQQKTVAELREIAKGINHEAVQGYTQMNKEHLLRSIGRALDIDMHAHHHVADGFDKNAVKARMRLLKTERSKALDAQDYDRVRAVRRELHALNHRIRANTV